MKRHIVERLLFFYKFFTISTPVLAVVVISTMTMNHPGGQIKPLGTALATLDFTPTEQINTPIAGDIEETPEEIAQEEPSQNLPETAPQTAYQITPQATTSQATSKIVTKTVQTTPKSPKPTPIDYNKIHLDDQGHPIEHAPVTPSIDNDNFPDMTEDICSCPPSTPETPESPEEDTPDDTPESPDSQE